MKKVFSMLLAVTVVSSFSFAMDIASPESESNGNTSFYCPVVGSDEKDTLTKLTRFYQYVNARKADALDAIPATLSVLLTDAQYAADAIEDTNRREHIYELMGRMRTELRKQDLAAEQRQLISIQLEAISHARAIRMSLNQSNAYLNEFLRNQHIHLSECNRLRNYVEAIKALGL